MKLTTPVGLIGAIVATGLLAAGCGGASYGGGGSSTASSTSPASNTSAGYGYGHSSGSGNPMAASGPATIAVKSSSLGQILVDGKGMTLYLFEKDIGTTSMCSGSCAQFWPPVTTKGAAKAGSGIMASKLGTTMRSDGKTQVTYNGHPLYYYAGDQKPGDVNGQGQNAFGALWYVMSPAGNAITG